MQSEIKLQAECFQWYWNTHIHERGLLCYNLNNSANKIQGNQNKALGLIKGRSDMVLYRESGVIMLEFKTESGVQTKEQKEWQSIVEAQGFRYEIIRNFNDFKKIIGML